MSLPTRSSSGSRARVVGSVAISTTIDQVLSSASNALLVFVLAQVSSAGHFGIIAMLITVLAVCTGFNRGALGTPLLLTGKNRQIVAESSYAVTWALYSSVLGGVLILTVGAVFHHPGIGLALAVGLPAVLVQDVLRLTAIGLGRPGLAVVADALWVASMLGIFVANLLGVRESAEFSIYLWGLSALVSAAVLAFGLRVAPHHSGILDWWRTYWPARVRFGSSYSISQIGYVFMTLAVVATAGSVAAAGIRGAFTMFGPMATLLTAVPMVFLPHAARTGNSLGDRWRLLSRTSLATSVLTLVAAGCLMAVPARLGAAILGASWQETFSVIPYVGVTSAAMCWIAGAFTFFQSQGASRTVFCFSTLLVGLQVATCLAAGLVFGSAIAIAISLAFCTFVIALAGVLWVRRSIHGVAEPSCARPGSAVNACGGIAIQ
jgi:O-antigen/teichoic acid export membrane protein